MHITSEQVVNKWKQYTLTNDHGMEVSILNFGGIITKFIAPDKHGNKENIVLGYENLEEYAENPNYFGAVIGRVAGRIANASFELNGTSYELDTNEGKHHLHGGEHGFSHVVWHAETFSTDGAVGVKLTHESPDGEGGYPGNLRVTVTYSLTNANELVIDYEADSDQSTVLTMTNHSYFNLSGNLKETIAGHDVQIASKEIVELDKELIPTGQKLGVGETPFDFRNGRKLQDGILSAHPQNQLVGNGYDHYFIFKKDATEQVKVTESGSGRSMTISTDQPGMVMYTGNGLDEGLQLVGGSSRKHLGVCFETQASPASLEHEGFPDIRLETGETYKKKTTFRFNVE
ncbi:galactose mutarotase [Virgibacillus halodenitrificans]|uniref:aldose epimerase family protein n=1 Tax=Virgibacillus halodenitrificans TaxID=1482 RepID=UPI001FB29446|nr:aldose epimerase family protein [Virgibacillus halodenitrificans]MCJ0929672.1 galactose mutarotase [Virgibacillus halodenitrificans]